MTASAHKQHYLTLDFLRGTAALCVLLLHWFDGVGMPWCHYGFLAVDFFFLLSGFVIAHSYERRLLDSMSVGRFLWLRFVRLYPMIVIGVTFGLTRAVLRGHFAPEYALPPVNYLLLYLANLVMLPIPRPSIIGVGIFPLDAVIWSLFFELLANVFYAVFVRRLTRRVLAVVVALGLIGLAAIVVAGIASEGGLNAGAEQSSFWGGFPRVFFAFFLGVLLYRLRGEGRLPSFAAGPLLLSVVLMAVLCLPKGWLPPWGEFAAVTLLFPVIVMLGANHSPQGRVATASHSLGELSYPIYLLQVPIMWIGSGALKAMHLYDRLPLVWVGILLMFVIAAISWTVLKLVDEPVRSFLSGLARKAPVKEGA